MRPFHRRDVVNAATWGMAILLCVTAALVGMASITIGIWIAAAALVWALLTNVVMFLFAPVFAKWIDKGE